jgi:hypothetical protein
MPDSDGAHPPIPTLVREKLAAFGRMARVFQASFAYVQQIHGQCRFQRVPVSASVRYLHALWVCDCKDAFLSVPLTLPRYGRGQALDLLRDWQDGASAEVIAFLEQKLDMLSFVQLTREVEEAGAAGDAAVVERLHHGREILVNRGLNLHRALDAIVTLPADRLRAEVRAACARYRHSPEQTREQLALFDTPLYSYLPHPELARRNMLVMNQLGVRITDTPADRPGARTARVSAPQQPLPPYARMPLAHQTAFIPPPYSTLPYYSMHASPPAAEGADEVVNSREM